MNEIYQKLLEQLACEFICKPQDFSLDMEAQNIVTLSVLNEGRRHFSAFYRGAIPYYGTSLSNLGSWKTALASGFEPAWIETEARECL